VTAENFDHLLEAMLSQDPFRIFTIELHGGRRFEIDHPRATVYRNGTAIFIASGGVPIWFGHESVSRIIGAPADTAP
jgi:hypothetical protein